MSTFRKIQDRENAALFLSFVLDVYKNLGKEMVPPLLLAKYQGQHKHIQEGLKHLLNYLEEEEN